MNFCVIGVSGSGKTELAQQIADKYGLKLIELDSLYWLKDWQKETEENFRKKLHSAMNSADKGWVVDSFYTIQGERPMMEADVVVFLDIPLPVQVFRVIRRSIQQYFGRELLWGVNRQTIFRSTRIVYRVFRWKPRAQEIMHDYQQSKPEHATFVKFTKNRDARSWLKTLELDTLTNK